MILILIKKRLLLGMAITIPSALLLIAYGTLNLWLTFMFGGVVLLLFLDLRRSVLLISITVMLTVGGGWALFMVNPGSAETAYLRSRNITVGRPLGKFLVSTEYNLLSRIDPVRYAEIINVFDSMGKRYSYLWGTGYGGYYEDSVVHFPKGLITAFPEYSLDAGRYYTAHSFSILMFLKYGLIGMLFIYAIWLIPGYSLFKIWRKRNMFAVDQPIFLHGTMLCIAAFLPTAMFQTYWSGKGLFINGLIIASIIEFARHYPIGASSQKMPQHTAMKIMK